MPITAGGEFGTHVFRSGLEAIDCARLRLHRFGVGVEFYRPYRAGQAYRHAMRSAVRNMLAALRFGQDWRITVGYADSRYTSTRQGPGLFLCHFPKIASVLQTLGDIYDMTEDLQLKHLLTMWCKAFQNCDPSAMKELWDHSGGVIYQSEEMDHVLLTWDAVDEYWDKIPDLIDDIPEWDPMETHYLRHGDSATIYAKLHTKIRLAGSQTPLIGDLRVTLGARLIGDAWKLVSLHESRQIDLTPFL